MILDRIHEVFHQRKVAKLRANNAKIRQENDDLRAEIATKQREIAELRRRIAEKEEIAKNHPPQSDPES